MSWLFGLSRQNSAIVSTMFSDSGFYSPIKKRLACNDTARRFKFRLISYKLSLVLFKHNAQHSAKWLCSTPQKLIANGER